MMLRLPDKQKQKCFMIWAAQLVVFLKGTDIVISIQIVHDKYFAIKIAENTVFIPTISTLYHLYFQYAIA